jgi:hypothetical protein
LVGIDPTTGTNMGLVGVSQYPYYALTNSIFLERRTLTLSLKVNIEYITEKDNVHCINPTIRLMLPYMGTNSIKCQCLYN